MIAEDLMLYLVDQGYGIQGVDVFYNFQPDNPDSSITVYDESAPVLEESHALSVDQLGVQILVRRATSTQARDVIMSIHRSLVGFGGVPFIFGGAMVHAVFVVTVPTTIGMDDKGRAEWTAHYRLRVESEGDLFRS